MPDPHGRLLVAAAARARLRAVPQADRRQAAEAEHVADAGGRQTRWWQRGRVDYVGAALMALALAGVTIGLGTGTQTVDTGTAPQAATPGALAVAGGGAVCLRRSSSSTSGGTSGRSSGWTSSSEPPFAAANIAHLLVGAALIIGMVEIPLYAYTLFGMTEIEGGLLLIRLTLMIPVGAVDRRLAGRPASATGSPRSSASSSPRAATSSSAAGRSTRGQLQLTRDLMISGLGFGLVIGPIGASVTSSAGPRWMATGSALVTVSRMVGMVVGLSALSSWGVRRFNALAADITIPIVRPAGLTDAQWQAMQGRGRGGHEERRCTRCSASSSSSRPSSSALAVIPAFFFYKQQGAGDQPAALPAPLKHRSSAGLRGSPVRALG